MDQGFGDFQALQNCELKERQLLAAAGIRRRKGILSL